MRNKIAKIVKEIIGEPVKNQEELELFRIKYLGSKNTIKELFSELKNVPNESKKEVGQLLNSLKNQAQERFDIMKIKLGNSSVEDLKIDMSRPGDQIEVGSRHPLSLVRGEIIGVFDRIGFTVSEGPEIEDDWHNFSALNFPPEHPARDMQDTFFIEKDENEMALRTHTSSVQVRVMENEKPPIRTISPGRVYRNEAISARAHCFFHQIEGLYIDKDVSFADLKLFCILRKRCLVKKPKFVLGHHTSLSQNQVLR